MRKFSVAFFLLLTVCGCKEQPAPTLSEKKDMNKKKLVIYQVFTRLFGNTDTTNKPWGTLAENGVGKFNDFTDKALSEIKDLGVTHVWYTGVPHHAVIRDYTKYGITNDDPDVVKGRAGSPYAVKDYYNVNPDLAVDPQKRLEEFQALIKRSHAHGLKVIIDIVPNHVARHYRSTSKPEGVTDFGAEDDTTKEYHRNNNFYYIPGQSFAVPHPHNIYKPLGGEPHPLSDGRFDENPAKWTGNGSRRAQPDFNDWYETVKINYGVRPDGSLDFDTLPAHYATLPAQDHFNFWKEKDVPSSWKKFRDIAMYWLKMGVDGFRFDMAEMVPVEFWSYLNATLKVNYPDVVCVAEVYNPSLYRNYIHLGKMDYLYDKVELYDSLKYIIQGKAGADPLPSIQDRLKDIEHHMLHFMENHDEQRIASPEFAGYPQKAWPAMVVSATISTSPTLIYFGQEVGEPGAENAGFGSPSRTSIFDYIGVPHHQRWMNNGLFDGGLLSESEKLLRNNYKTLLNFTITNNALQGEYADLHWWNRQHSDGYHDMLYSYARWNGKNRLIVTNNFSPSQTHRFSLKVPEQFIQNWQLKDGEYKLADELAAKKEYTLEVKDGQGKIDITLAPLQSVLLTF
jgi:glycosidase